MKLIKIKSKSACAEMVDGESCIIYKHWCFYFNEDKYRDLWERNVYPFGVITEYDTCTRKEISILKRHSFCTICEGTSVRYISKEVDIIRAKKELLRPIKLRLSSGKTIKLDLLGKHGM